MSRLRRTGVILGGAAGVAIGGLFVAAVWAGYGAYIVICVATESPRPSVPFVIGGVMLWLAVGAVAGWLLWRIVKRPVCMGRPTSKSLEPILCSTNKITRFSSFLRLRDEPFRAAHALDEWAPTGASYHENYLLQESFKPKDERKIKAKNRLPTTRPQDLLPTARNQTTHVHRRPCDRT